MSGVALSKRALAEACGTFFLTFIGAGSAVAAYAAGATGAEGLLVAAFANGLALAVAVSATMNVSGGNINPAVSFALFLTRKLSPGTTVVYAASQVIGSTVAAALLRALLPVSAGSHVLWGTPTISPSITVVQGALFEAVLTFILVFTVFGTAVDERAPKIGGLGIGLAVVGDVLVGGAFTGAAMNPAREIGPALVSGYLANWYVYWVGDLLGAALAAVAYGYFILERRK